MSKFQKIYLKSMIFVIFSLSVFPMASYVQGTQYNQFSTRDSFYISGVNGSYGDFDNDGAEDDVLVIFNLNAPRKSSGYQKFDVYFTLILPSGLKHETLFMVFTRVDPIPTLAVYGFNTASEAGWYTVVLESLLYGCKNPAYFSLDHIFDPPGTGGSGDITYKINVF